MIVRANLQAIVNEKIAEWTGTHADDQTFTVPLYNAQNEIIAYWCDWSMSATGHDVQSFVQYLLANTSLDADDITLREGAVGIGSRKALIFDAEKISPEAVLTHLNLQLEA
jgi:hypothetical protein